MLAKRQSGYTIVEVTLFLAISGALFLIAMMGTSNTIRGLRFSDSVRSLHAFVQKKYDDVVSVVNERPETVSCAGGVVDTTPATPQNPGTSNCIVMGKLFAFTPGQSRVDVYNIVGVEPAILDVNQADEDLIQDYQLREITNNGVDNYQISWQSVISGIKRTNDNSATNRLAIIRSPRSNRVISYTFKDNITLQAAVNNPSANAGKTVNFCIKNSDGFGNPAKLVINNAPNQSAAQVVFDSQDTECDGV